MSHSAVPIGVPEFESIDDMYNKIIEQCESVIRNDDKDVTSAATSTEASASKKSDWRLFSRLTTSLSNISSILFYSMNAQHTAGRDEALLHSLPINWCGFYLLDRPDRLALSSFQGKLACTHIKLGRGMCGIAALTNKDIAIADVTSDPQHIACDAASQSEAVIVLRDPRGRPVGVLDIDSAVKGKFSETDLVPLRRLCDIITEHHSEELFALFRGATGGRPEPAASAVPSASTAAGGGASATMTSQLRHHHAHHHHHHHHHMIDTPAPFATQKQHHHHQQPLTAATITMSPEGRPIIQPLAGGSVATRAPNVIAPRRQEQKQPGATTNNNETADIKRHRDWELRQRTVPVMLDSAKLGQLEERLQVKLLPEIVFDMNEVHFVKDEGAGARSLKFRVDAQSALANVVEYVNTEEYASVRDKLFPKESAAWTGKREEFATFDPKVDWAFRNDYRGVWTRGGAGGAEDGDLKITPESVDPGAKDDKNDGEKEEITIDYDLLRRTDLPILFFTSIDLFEDDLHDSGVSKVVCKARVMEPCFFVLVRHILRVDGVRLQIRDTRHFHKFGNPVIVIEESMKTVDVVAYLAQNPQLEADNFNRMLGNTAPEQLDMLKTEWTKNFVIRI